MDVHKMSVSCGKGGRSQKLDFLVFVQNGWPLVVCVACDFLPVCMLAHLQQGPRVVRSLSLCPPYPEVAWDATRCSPRICQGSAVIRCSNMLGLCACRRLPAHRSFHL